MKQVYIRNKRQYETGKGGFAIGYEPIMDNPDGSVSVAVSFAFCSDNDSFVRSRARDILTGRLRKGLIKGEKVTGKFEIITLMSAGQCDQSFATQLKEMYAA